jgi:hypothetical protein
MISLVRARLPAARPADGLKVAEMLAKMCGWNEAEQVRHDHVHLQVDSALIAQLREGYAQFAQRTRRHAWGNEILTGRPCMQASDSRGWNPSVA